jgi:hypothetical protein
LLKIDKTLLHELILEEDDGSDKFSFLRSSSAGVRGKSKKDSTEEGDIDEVPDFDTIKDDDTGEGEDKIPDILKELEKVPCCSML